MEASGNAIAARLFANAQLLAITFAWDLGYGKPGWFAEIARRAATDHRTVGEAIGRRDPRAAREAMTAHVAWAREAVPEQLAAIAETRR